MITVTYFTFGPFQENTYILYDETQECIVVDPGCYGREEKKELVDFIELNKLRVVKLINTHGHIDHMLGNNFVAGKFNVALEMNEHDVKLLLAAPTYGQMWGIAAEPSPEPGNLLSEGDRVKFGNSVLEVLFTPGHSEGSISFYSREDDFVIAGDVLFNGSIGRTDLPGGNFDTLISSIKEKLFPLGDDCKVYSGHGPVTTIGFEKEFNPFL
ncbi:MAG: MBL fold metallo-hydrolase [Bacteroidetes bacterium]|nr:MBL fold metallo-hydrolase [Bacteroidota bacterium]